MKLYLFGAGHHIWSQFQVLYTQRQWASSGRKRQGQGASKQQQHTSQHQHVLTKHGIKATFSSHVCNLLFSWKNANWLISDGFWTLCDYDFDTWKRQGMNRCFSRWSSFVRLWCLGKQLRLISYAQMRKKRCTRGKAVDLPLWQSLQLLVPLLGLKELLELV